MAVEPDTPQHWFAQGTGDPTFRTKPQIALALVDQAVAQDWPFRAVVAGPYGPELGRRLVIATPDPATLPAAATQLAIGVAAGAGLAGTGAVPVALLVGLVGAATTTGAAGPAL